MIDVREYSATHHIGTIIVEPEGGVNQDGQPAHRQQQFHALQARVVHHLRHVSDHVRCEDYKRTFLVHIFWTANVKVASSELSNPDMLNESSVADDSTTPGPRDMALAHIHARTGYDGEQGGVDVPAEG